MEKNSGKFSPVRPKGLPAVARIQITDPVPILSPKQKALQKNEKLFRSALDLPVVDIDKIREHAWMGIPESMRPTVWRLFLDYEPISRNSSISTLQHKRNDYFDCLERLYGRSQQALWTSSQKQTIHQIEIDLPRTPNKLLKDERVKSVFEHILFVWAVRHPASGYVQGMNDILLPFFVVFVSQYLSGKTIEEICKMEEISCVSDESLKEVESDCFWCFSKLLDGIQDVFTKDQPGLFRMISNLENVVAKVDPDLSKLFKEQGVGIDQFAFRWINCLLVREFPLSMLLRIWDLYVSQVTKIASTHVFVCAAMLDLLAPKIKKNPSECLIFMQSLTPESWTQEELETVLAQAYVFERTLSFSPVHPRSSFA